MNEATFAVQDKVANPKEVDEMLKNIINIKWGHLEQ